MSRKAGRGDTGVVNRLKCLHVYTDVHRKWMEMSRNWTEMDGQKTEMDYYRLK